MKVTKAVIPVGGLGTRFLPATKAQPKEMLPVGGKPAIQYAIEEAIAAGISDILLITGRHKRAIEDHLDDAPELEQMLCANGKAEELKTIKNICNGATIHWVRQPSPRGLGDAVKYAENHVHGEPFALILPDDIFDARQPATAQLIEKFEQYNSPILGIEKVPREEAVRYGVINPRKVDGKTVYLDHKEERVVFVDGIVEKPKIEEAPSNMIVAGRYVLTSDVFEYLKSSKPLHGELQITSALQQYVDNGKAMYGYVIEGTRLDAGTFEGWNKANLYFAKKDAKLWKELKAYMKELDDKASYENLVK